MPWNNKNLKDPEYAKAFSDAGNAQQEADRKLAAFKAEQDRLKNK